MNEAGMGRISSRELTLEGEDDERQKFSHPAYSLDEEWVLNYIKQFGTEPSFF